MQQINFRRKHDKKMVAICHHLAMRFSKVKKDWSFDDNLMNRQCIERLFPGSFPQEPSKEKELAVPDFLMDHQKRVLAICAKRDRFGIFHDTGTGKTLETLEIIRHHNVKTLIVCPLSLIEGAWMQETRDRYPGMDTSNLWTAKKKSPVALDKALEKKLCIINYEAFRTIDKKLAGAGFDMVVLDESARIKSPKSSTSKKIIDFCDNVKYVYLLSGVPAPNGEYDYWTQVRILDPLLWDRSSYKFRKRFFYDGQYGGCGEIRSEYVQKIKDDVATVAEYVNKADVLDLPERTDSMRIFQLSSEEQKHYKNIKNHLVTMLSEGETIESPNAVTAIMKLRQLSSGILLEKVLDCEDTAKKLKYKTIVHKIGESKLKEYMQLVEDIGNKQIVTWIQFKAEAQIIKEALAKTGKKGEILNSTATEAEKQKYLKDFKSGKLQYIICHPKSVGYGHTLTNCSESVYK
jgi:SNF2 family DNA or RNA helicase